MAPRSERPDPIPRPATPEEWRERVGVQLEAGRKANGITSMREAARRAAISEATWRQLESGRRQVAPDVIVAPSPKAETLISAAMVAGLQPGALLEAAGYSIQDIEMADRLEVAYLAAEASARHHGEIAQRMVRTPAGRIDFRTVPELEERPEPAAILEARMRSIWDELSYKGREQVLGFAADIQAQEIAEWEHIVGKLEDKQFAQAARSGSPDPHDDQVGEVTVRHPGGSAPEDIEG